MTRHPSTLAIVVLALLVLPTAGRSEELVGLNFNGRDWPPYFVKGKGFAREVIESCLPAAGYVARFAEITLEQTFLGLQSGVLDGHVLGRTPDRERFLHFSNEPIFADGYHPIVRSDSGIQVRTLRDLERLRVGHLPGSRAGGSFATYIKQRDPALTFTFRDHEELLQALLAKKIDVFFGLRSSIRLMAAERKLESRVTILPWILTAPGYFLAISRRTPRVRDHLALFTAFDDCVRRLKSDGTYDRLSSKYTVEAH